MILKRLCQNLDPNKIYGHDTVSICMTKIYGKSIYKSFQLMFNLCIETGSFWLAWKKANVVPVHQKGYKKCLKIYKPVSLLPICKKILERQIINTLLDRVKASVTVYFLN